MKKRKEVRGSEGEKQKERTAVQERFVPMESADQMLEYTVYMEILKGSMDYFEPCERAARSLSVFLQVEFKTDRVSRSSSESSYLSRVRSASEIMLTSFKDQGVRGEYDSNLSYTISNH